MNITKHEPNPPPHEPLHVALKRESYTIELNGAEMLALIEVCRCVGGLTESTARRFTQGLANYRDEFHAEHYSLGLRPGPNRWFNGTLRAATL